MNPLKAAFTASLVSVSMAIPTGASAATLDTPVSIMQGYLQSLTGGLHPITLNPWQSITVRPWKPITAQPVSFLVVANPSEVSSARLVSQPAPTPSDLPTKVQEVLNLTNQDRVQNGLPPLAYNVALSNIAVIRATHEAQMGQIYDYDPVYGWPVQQEQAAGLRFSPMGAQNSAIAGRISEANTLLMASPLHRQNILDPSNTQMGIGVVPLPAGNGYAIVEEFAGPASP